MGARSRAMAKVEASAERQAGIKVQCMNGARDIPGSVDNYVRGHPAATPYHRIAWLRAVKGGYGHTVTILVAFNGEQEVVGVLPLCHLALPLYRPALVSQAYCDIGGPLANDADIEQALTNTALSLAGKVRARSLEFRLAGPPVASEQALSSLRGSKVSMLCPLPPSREALFQSYKPKLRSQIRKAEKNGLVASIGHGPDAIDAFYPVFAANMHRLGSPVHGKSWFRSLQSCYGDDMVIGLVSFEEQVVGAGIVLVNGTRAAIPWASTRAEYNHLAPNMLLYWTLLGHLADSGITVFDFGRSSPGEGTYRFKKQWGAVPHELNWVDLLEKNKGSGNDIAPSRISRARLAAERIWRCLPMAVANRFGPLIRKYISL